MWETVIAAAVVFVALVAVGFGLYRNASGKSGCTGCGESSCSDRDGGADSASRE